MKYELYLYQTLMTVDRKYIVKEAFNNLLNLKLFNNIDNKKYIFINKMNEINNELNNFHNFEYKPINKINNQNNEKYNNGNNKISIQKNVNDKIINKNIHNNKNKIEEKTYLQYFKEPEKPLYQIYGIKLEDIERRNSYIINKLINISVDLEEEYNINERNSFFEILNDFLKYEFKKKYQNLNLENNEKIKRELSSWYNQSLIIDESDHNYKRFFLIINLKWNYIELEIIFKIQMNGKKYSLNINIILKNYFLI